MKASTIIGVHTHKRRGLMLMFRPLRTMALMIAALSTAASAAGALAS